MTNQSYHHGDLKAELIRTGLKLLDQEGYEGFSLRKVAKACNVSQTAPYRHFKDKDELIAAITLEALRAFNESLKQAVEQYPDDPKQQLAEMGVAYIRFFSENPEYLRLLFLSNMESKMNAMFNCTPGAITNEYPFQTFSMAIERFIEAYPHQLMSKEELLVYCWGLVHGISVLIANKDIPHQEDYQSLVRNIITVSLNVRESR